MYKLKDFVTDEMLIECGYRIVFDKTIRAIKTLSDCSVFIEKNRELLAWQQNHIQDLIEKGYVEVVE